MPIRPKTDEELAVEAALRPGFVTVDDYLKLPREKETYLLKPLIPTSGAALLYGAEKTGKSYLGIQLAAALSGSSNEWLGFPIMKHGKVLYFQLDTPRSTWAQRFSDMIGPGGLKVTSDLMLADRESIIKYPFDILQPDHMEYLYAIVQVHKPVCVIIDTLRESHSGDEDSSTISRNVIANLVGATHPAALIIVSHSRKPHPDADKNLMADHRGSSYVTGRMDAIIRLTKTRLYYTGRSIEEGDIKLERMDNGLWQPKPDESGAVMDKVLRDTTMPSMRAKARAIAPLLGKSEEAAMSMLRRHTTLLSSRLAQGEEGAPQASIPLLDTSLWALQETPDL